MRIQTLGSAEIIIGQTALRPDSAVAFGLLLYLGLTAGKRVPRARLVELFWPDQPETQSRHALRQLLYRLRRIGLPLAEGGEELRVDAAVVDCDAAPILAPSWSATCSERDAMDASQFLTDFNPEISGPFSEWLDELRNRVARRYADASLRHLATARREARWSDVFDWSTRGLAVDPLNQDATYALAEATAMRGAKVEAVRILDEYSREIGALDGRVGLSTRVLRQRVSEAHGIGRNDGRARHLLVGRDEEVARLVRIVEDTARDHGGVLWIYGAPGIGKTRLALELRREAVIRGFASAVVSLQSNDRYRPFSVLSEIVIQLLKLPGALGCAPTTLSILKRLIEVQELDPEAESPVRDPMVRLYEIREAVVELFSALESEAPLIIHIDDFHNADQSSKPVLTELIERVSPLRVLWLLTSRPSNERPAVALRSTLELMPLSANACRQLVDVLVPNLPDAERRTLTNACTQITGGNPFFAQEIIHFWDRSGGTGKLPGSISRVIADQLSRLNESALRLLQVIAMLGSIATLRRSIAVLGRPIDDLLRGVETLDSQGILSLSDEDGEFSMHDLWREAALRSLRPMVKQVLHARIADIVEEEAERAGEATLLWNAASHRSESGEPERAMKLFASCSSVLLALGLPEEAAETMRRALSLCRTPQQELHCRKLRLSALQLAAKWSTIQIEVEETVTLAQSIDPKYDHHNDLELLSVEAMLRADQELERAAQVCLGCGQETRASTDHRIRALLKCICIADNLCQDNILREAYQLLRTLASDNSEYRCEVLISSTVYNSSMGSLDAAIQDSAELVRLQRQQASISALTWALRISATPLRIAGEIPLAIERISESLRIAEKYNLSEDAATCCDSLATISLESGLYSEARAAIERAEEWSRNVDTKYWRLSARSLRAALAVGEGDAGTALRELGESVEPYANDPLVRQGLQCLTVLADAFRIEDRRAALEETLGAMAVMMPRMLTKGRTDRIVYSYVAGLQKLQKSSEASTFLQKYITRHRRDRGAIFLPDTIV
jgi:DNA-binding SARP family transcriptional activator/predicted ATPase